MIFLTIFLASCVSIMLIGCFSKPAAPQTNKPSPVKKAEAKKVPAKDNKTKIPPPAPSTSVPSSIPSVPLKTSPDGCKTAHPPKHPEPVVMKSVQLNKTKDGPKKKTALKTQESAYAGVEKSEVKLQSPKTPSVITLPTKESSPPPKETPKVVPKVEINENSDDTIEDIPSVRAKDGPSFERESKETIGTKEDGVKKSTEGEKK
uniref:Uncharacterized protein n=1 Tax=Caenorhabditis tropicalis TaxID=1561998 RepID=A0A1I7TC98_9PELO